MENLEKKAFIGAIARGLGSLGMTLLRKTPSVVGGATKMFNPVKNKITPKGVLTNTGIGVGLTALTGDSEQAIAKTIRNRNVW
jgi:hypothetical protein